VLLPSHFINIINSISVAIVTLERNNRHKKRAPCWPLEMKACHYASLMAITAAERAEEAGG
jgi:hypothetical protein